MNTPADHDPELRCAEYALGVLDAPERAALEQAVRTDADLAATLARWERRFAPLAEDLAPIAAPARVWIRIERDLGFLPTRQPGAAATAAAAAGWWNDLRLWRFVGIGASVAALALAAVNLVWMRATPVTNQVASANPYMVATIARPDGVANWTATFDQRRKDIVLVPAVKPTIEAGRATELWLIQPGEKPVSLGVFPANTPATLTLTANVAASVNARTVLAVSIEPPGGSPTGQPTGPVVATGPMKLAV
ncbi:anti-sigma-K factor RskA [Paraburkholderia bannensis]|uniref:Anti-sigma-K factor RskA n=1 Tax=Paraburkholderia bannensis TaxID=765414 RepID=A0A7W9U2W9_9BURK|nr:MULTISPECIES: anti-sigma factor [Paraburkholderia]MBB3261016.1 anti-sigma-K factor RskA [Paraburkholderia sp. WP4_3_2]MBB6106053.1 anti-sigma-K factor RskA [Paraburkholderia bannensis]